MADRSVGTDTHRYDIFSQSVVGRALLDYRYDKIRLTSHRGRRRGHGERHGEAAA